MEDYLEVGTFYYKRPLYTQLKVPNYILDDICKEVFEIWDTKDSKDEYNQELIGNIENEFKLPSSGSSISILKLASIAANNYLKNTHNSFQTNDNETHQDCNFLIEKNFWVNFQKKYEYNPIHSHSGDFSFVLWLKVPYLIDDEKNHPNCIKTKYNDRKNGVFSFAVPSIFTSIDSVDIPADKNYEGIMVVFPSQVKHVVYPFFTSDEYRISISGNLIEDT